MIARANNVKRFYTLLEDVDILNICDIKLCFTISIARHCKKEDFNLRVF